jgi:trimethylamine--corrinoid protein Co-methyltransferase
LLVLTNVLEWGAFVKNIFGKIEVLTKEEIETIHNSSLRILENIGARVPHQECLSICEKLGARVDRDKCTLKISASLMEQVLSKVRESITDKEGNYSKVKKLTGNISTQVFFVDYISKSRRYGTMDDVMKGIALVEHLDNFPNANAVVIPHDVPFNLSDVLTFQKVYTYSSKPGGTYILSPFSAKYILQMAKVMGRKIEYLFETISPLSFRKETLEIAILFAKEGQPLKMAPMVMAASSGPVSLAGMLTLQNAEVLLSLFIIYALTNEFTPYIVGGHTNDLRTMLCSFGSPNQALIGMGAAQMAEYYGLMSGSNSGLSDALLPDFQCGFEKASTAIFSCLAGTSEIGGQGIVGADQGISFEQLVIDNEWIDAYNYIMQGIEVNDDSIGLDVIEKVGIGGNFVSENHTVEYMHDNYWPSRIFSRDCWDSAYNKTGAKGIIERAHEFVDEKTKNAFMKDPVIDSSKIETLDYIVREAEKDIISATKF